MHIHRAFRTSSEIPGVAKDRSQSGRCGDLQTATWIRTKAPSLKSGAQEPVERHGGKVPSTMEELTRLPGVGRKTANVILGYAFDVPAIVVDTHCRRLSRRLGLTKNEDPNKIENELRRLLPAEEWLGFSHRLIIHGRRICQAQKPKSEECMVNDLCPSSRVSSNRTL
ncbi:MAG: endonuclease III [Deltaproteobacteria bacterium]|nr:endonuclease III [Deltaproteobacteria bacterium]